MSTPRIPFTGSSEASTSPSRRPSDNESTIDESDLHGHFLGTSQHGRRGQWDLKAVKVQTPQTTMKNVPAFDSGDHEYWDPQPGPSRQRSNIAPPTPRLRADPAWGGMARSFAMNGRSQTDRPRRQKANYDFEPSENGSGIELDELPLPELSFGQVAHSNLGQRRGSSIIGAEAFSDEEDAEALSRGRGFSTAGPSTARHERPRAWSPPPTSQGRMDLYGGKSKRELYRSYHGKSPLGPVDTTEPKDHSWREEERAAAAVPLERDVEAQGRRAQMRGCFDDISAGVLAWFEANPRYKAWALTVGGLFMQFLFVLLLLLLLVGVLAPKPRDAPMGQGSDSLGV